MFGYGSGFYIAAIAIVVLFAFLISGAWLLMVGIYEDQYERVKRGQRYQWQIFASLFGENERPQVCDKKFRTGDLARAIILITSDENLPGRRLTIGILIESSNALFE
jgi:hypothetical protein